MQIYSTALGTHWVQYKASKELIIAQKFIQYLYMMKVLNDFCIIMFSHTIELIKCTSLI